VSGSTVGLAVLNSQNQGGGNDVAFDLPKITEVTPQMDKTFDPASPDAGTNSTLTITVTNTDDLMAKGDGGFSFTDLLTKNVSVASTPVTDCGTGVASAGHDDATGRDSVTLTNGTLAAGQTSCTVTVEVTTNYPGTYDNSAGNMTDLYGVNPPGKTSVEFEPPTLKVEKTASPDTLSAPGQVSYSIKVTNEGHIPVTNIGVTDTNFSGLNGPLAALSCSPVALGGTLPGQSSTTCTVTYDVDQAEFDAGATITNSATAKGSFYCQADLGSSALATCTITSDPDSATVTMDQQPQLTLTKTNDAGSTPLHTGASYTYTFNVTNSGNVTVTGVTIDDSGTTPGAAQAGFTGTGGPLVITCGAWPSGTVGTLLPGDSVTCTAPYTVTPADTAAGTIDNTAKVTGKDPSNQDVTDFDSSAAPTTAAPGISLDKEHLSLPATVQAGDVVTYTFLVRNTADVPVNTVSVTDAKVGTVTCPGGSYEWPDFTNPGVLRPGEAVPCMGSYTLTQADIDAGYVDNTAEADAMSVTSTPTKVTATDADTVTDLSQPAITVAKSANVSSVNKPQSVTYSFQVTNTGNTTLTNVRINDPRISSSDMNCSLTTLAPGQMTSCTVPYPVTQTMIDTGGSIDNTVTATGTPRTGADVTDTDSYSITVTQNPQIYVTKDASPTTVSKSGDKVTYTFTVTNYGNVTLSDVTLDDPMLGLAGYTCDKSELPPAGFATCTADYTVTQDDIDHNAVLTNSVTATGTSPLGVDVTNTGTADVDVTHAPAISVTKSADPSTLSAPGLVTYTFEVTNTGNMTLSSVRLDDAMLGLTASSCGTTVLDPGEMTMCMAIYDVTQTQIDAGTTLTNHVTATGTPPTGSDVTATDSADVTMNGSSGISLTKTASVPSVTKAGDVIGYNLVVTNTGDVSLSNVSVSDTSFNGKGTPPTISCPKADLSPTEAMTCTASYTVVQADVDQLTQIANTAEASGTDPAGHQETADSTATVDLTPTSSITVDKSAAEPAVGQSGDTIHYYMVVTNTGDTTVSNIAVTDKAFNGNGTSPSITCPKTTLAPGETQTCTADYTAVQDDIDSLRTIVNTATVNGKNPFGELQTDESTATVDVAPSSSISLAKTADVSNVTAAGDGINYDLLVTNTGNMTLNNVSVSETAFNGKGTAPTISCPDTSLAPKAFMTCTASYTVVQNDIDQLTTITNTAKATGTDGHGTDQTDTSTATVDVNPTSSLTLLKTANVKSVTEAGDYVAYDFQVKNTGTSTLSNVSIVDTDFNGLGPTGSIVCPLTPLSPGFTMVCSSVYSTVQEDIDQLSSMVNTAKVTATGPSGAEPSATSTYIIDVVSTSGIHIAKIADVTHVYQAGDIIHYSLDVTNTGTTTLSNVSVADDSFNGMGTSPTITCPKTTLVSAEKMTCTASYTVVQDDIDLLTSIVNSATAQGTDPSGTDQTDTSMVMVGVNPASGISVDKQADVTAVSQAGDKINYTLLVKNTGQTTLSSISLSDTSFNGKGIAPTISCPAGDTLAPGAQMTCTASYTVVQDDIDQLGTIANTAQATCRSRGAELTGTSTASVNVNSSSGISIDKTATESSVTKAGDVIHYTLKVTNTGNTSLSSVAVTDTSFSGKGTEPTISCPKTALDPSEVMDCTASYTVVQGDVDQLTAISNTAEATGMDPSDTIQTDESTASVDVKPSSGIGLTKTASLPSVTKAGDVIGYTLKVTNTGTTTLSDVAVSDTAFNGKGTASTISCPKTALDPSEEMTCTASYTVVQADVDQLTSITNTAQASGKDPSGTSKTATDSATVTVSPSSGISVDKTADVPSVSQADDVINYTLKVKNTGTTTLSTVAVADSSFNGKGTAPSISCPKTTLAPGEEMDCTATYTVVQADIDQLGTVVNVAEATAKNPFNVDQSGTSTATVNVQSTSGISIVKTAGVSSVAKAGDTISYTMVVTNQGGTTLSTVSVVDSSFSGKGTPPVISCPKTTLAPAEEMTCTASYTVVQADVDQLTPIANTATASGKDPGGTSHTDDSTATVDVIPASGISVTKTSDVPSVAKAGDKINYTLVAKNTGDTTLSNVAVADSSFNGLGTPPTITCPRTTLAPAEQETCTASYTVVQADVDQLSSIANTATATGKDPSDTTQTGTSTATVTVNPASGISIVKSADPSHATKAGDTISYKLLVSNTGGTTLSTIVVADTAFNGKGSAPLISCPGTTLAPSAFMTCTASYTVVQADIDQLASIDNTAQATGKNPSGVTQTDTSTATVTLQPTSGISVDKTADVPSVAKAGDKINYTLVAKNTGDTTLSTVAVADSSFNGLGTPPTITCPKTTLAPAESMTCTAVYTVVQADVDRGSPIVNTATATGKDPSNTTQTGTSTATVTVTSSSGISVVKTADMTSVTKAGDVIGYALVVTNTGGTTLTNVSVADTSFTGKGTAPTITCPQTTLAPAEIMTCHASYTVVQADVDQLSSIANTAQATGKDPSNATQTGDSTATVPVQATSGISVTKTAGVTDVAEAGDVIDYTLVVTNTGTTTLSGVLVADTAFNGKGTPPYITCPQTGLTPGEQMTCTASYTVVQADIDQLGTIINTAQASGKDPSDTNQTATSTATVNVESTSGISIDKTADVPNVKKAGDKINYTLVVKNTGSTTLNSIMVTDTSFTGKGSTPLISCPKASLAPAEQMTCTATYTVLQADVDQLTSISNTAQATGKDSSGTDQTNTSTATVDLMPTSGISLVKTSNVPSVTKAGDAITYTMVVTNTGDTTLSTVAVADTSFNGLGTPPSISCPKTTLAPAEQETCTASYTVVQADIDRLTPVANTAQATANNPSGVKQTATDTASVTMNPTSGISVDKTADVPSVAKAGDKITYTMVVKNTGDTTLHTVTVVDSAFNGNGTDLSISCPKTTLVPAESMTCTATYTVVQADVDHLGTVVNTAKASGTDPSGTNQTGTSTATVNVESTSGISVVKTASVATVVKAGDKIDYTLVVSNTGGTTLSSVVVADTSFTGKGSAPTISCPGTTLAPAGQMTCTATYTVVQADVDQLTSISNTAQATGKDPSGTDHSNDSTATVDVKPSSGISVAKTADVTSVKKADDVINYTLVVKNTGDTSLSEVSVTDTSFNGRGSDPMIHCPKVTLAPGETMTCTASYTLVQADIDRGDPLVNAAQATGKNPSGDTQTGTSSSTVDVTPSSGISVAKTADVVSVAQAGDVIGYKLVVTNTGDTSLTGVSVADSSFNGKGVAPLISCPQRNLAPGESMTCTASYTVVQADVDQLGTVVNVAKATGTDPSGNDQTGTSTATVNMQSTSGLSLLKLSDISSVTKAGDKISYTLTVTNNGSTTLGSILVSDTSFNGKGTPPAISCPKASLAPAEWMTCTATYTVVQADIDQLSAIVNEGHATGKDPLGGDHSDDSTASVDVNPASGISVDKTADVPNVTKAGDKINYTLVVKNTGATTLSSVGVVDTSFSGKGTAPSISCPQTTLAPAEQETCTASYTVVQGDVDVLSSIDNTAKASGTDPSHNIQTDTSTASVAVTPTSVISIDKSADVSSVAKAGDTIHYTLAVANMGDTTLSGISVTDTAFNGKGAAAPSITCPKTALAPAESMTCTASYAVVQADIDNLDPLVNTAQVAAKNPSGADLTEHSTATVDVTPSSGISVDKTADVTSVTKAGDKINYTLVVKNTGATTLSDVLVTDTAFTGKGTPPSISCPGTTLAPAEQMTCTASYTVVQDDVDQLDKIANTAQAKGTDPSDTDRTGTSTATVDVSPTSGISLDKTSNASSVAKAGDTVTYTMVVTNTGDTTLSSILVSEASFNGLGTAPTVSCPQGRLAPGDSMSCTAKYTVVQADIDSLGPLVNVAKVTGDNPSGEEQDDTSSATVTVNPSSGITVDKSANVPSVAKAGDKIDYTMVVTNTGDTTLSGVAVTDTSFTGKGTSPTISCPKTTLAPAEVMTCTATYTVVQDDVDQLGTIVNVASVTGKDPSDTNQTDSSTATVNVQSTSGIDIMKSASVPTAAKAGDTINYTMVVKNTGSTTLSNVSVTDSSFNGYGTDLSITCPQTTLAPSESMTCTASYTVMQTDVDSLASIVNTAQATGEDPSGTSHTNDSTATVDLKPSSSISVVKTADVKSVAKAGGKITYTLLVTNTGDTTLDNVDVADTSFNGKGTPASISCPLTSLRPAQSMTCTASYTVVQGDIDRLDPIVNVAQATGDNPFGAHESGTSSSTVSVSPSSSITVAKSADVPDVAKAGDKITYTMVVTNTGDTTVGSILVTDSSFNGKGTPPSISCPAAQLAPGATMDCTATYTLVQADVDLLGTVVNVAKVTGIDPSGTTLSDSSSATVDVKPSSGISIVKSADVKTVAKSGDKIAYSMVVSNTGGTTVSGIIVTDSAFNGHGTPPAITCPGTVLAPSATMTCTANYTVVQADVDALVPIANTAKVDGVDSLGNDQSNTSTATVDVKPSSSVTIVKTADVSSVKKFGDMIHYTMVVKNTGDTTLSSVDVSESSFNGHGTPPPITCPKTTLAPDEQMSCTAVFSVTQADVDYLTSLDNVAAVTAKDPSNATLTQTSSASVDVEPTTSVAITKTASVAKIVKAGDQIDYTLHVTNTGDTSLSNVVVTDTSFTGLGTAPAISCPPTMLAPGESMNCTASYTVVQDDVDQTNPIANVAQVSARDTLDHLVTSTSSASVTVEPVSSIDIAKTADVTSVKKLGDKINYTLHVTDTGDTTLTSISVADTSFTGHGTAPMVTCPHTTLAPGEAMDCTASYTVVQADVDALSPIANTAQVLGRDPSGQFKSASSTASVSVNPTSGISLVKTASVTSVTKAGDVIGYTFVVTNTGDTTLSTINVVESSFTGLGVAPVVSCQTSTLPPGGSVNCAAIYSVTQADMDGLSSIANTASASGSDPAHVTQTSTSTATVDVVQSPDVKLTKSASPAESPLHEGDSLTYYFVIENTGNVTLHNVAIAEDTFTGSGTVPQASCPTNTALWGASRQVGVLAPGDAVTCSAVYKVTAADGASGKVDNTATVNTLTPKGVKISGSDSTTSPAVPDPKISVEKAHVTPTVMVRAGDAETYTFKVRNDGNVALNGITVSDPKIAGVVCPGAGYAWPDPSNPGVLVPGQFVTCTGSYVLTQADIDSDEVDNSATASGTSVSLTRILVTGDGTDTWPGLGVPALKLTKTVDYPDVTSAPVGATVNYSYVVENTGNTTIANVTVSEDSFDGTGTKPVVTCPVSDDDWPSGVVGVLPPGGKVTCAASYTLTQADTDATLVTNTASAHGMDTTRIGVSSGQSTATVAAGHPEITLQETAVLKGTRILYTFFVSNTGTMTLNNVQLSQTGFTGAGKAPDVVCPQTSLAPGESMTCTAVYQLTIGDYGRTIENPVTVIGVPLHKDSPTASDSAEIKLPNVTAQTGGSLAPSVSWPLIAAGILVLAGAVAVIVILLRRKKPNEEDQAVEADGSDSPSPDPSV